jgi:hypothetical protein
VRIVTGIDYNPAREECHETFELEFPSVSYEDIFPELVE